MRPALYLFLWCLAASAMPTALFARTGPVDTPEIVADNNRSQRGSWAALALAAFLRTGPGLPGHATA
jgi:hypothetical protein